MFAIFGFGSFLLGENVSKSGYTEVLKMRCSECEDGGVGFY